MSRTSVRLGVQQLVAGVTDTSGGLVFKAVYDVMPTNIAQNLTPAAFVMLGPEPSVEKRKGPQQKLRRYQCQVRVWWATASTGWQTPAGGSNLWVSPDNEPQRLFDGWLDGIAAALRADKQFSTDTPTDGAVTVMVGEPEIKTIVAEPVLEGETLILAGIVQFEAVEQLLGT